MSLESFCCVKNRLRGINSFLDYFMVIGQSPYPKWIRNYILIVVNKPTTH